ncbi:hypothetical protein G6F61_014693 [Rhizopus arrhizus]|nr:hypothetical protein G6F61_014693 [Rhizopus arrhizus]
MHGADCTVAHPGHRLAIDIGLAGACHHAASGAELVTDDDKRSCHPSCSLILCDLALHRPLFPGDPDHRGNHTSTAMRLSPLA